MGDMGISLDLGSALPYLEERLRQLVGKDHSSQETAAWFTNLQRTALIQAAEVKCIGMHRPVPLSLIYQPTRLSLRPAAARPEKASDSGACISVDDFLSQTGSAIIYAGPGWGKTTFLHYVFLTSVKRQNILPVLISLKRKTAVQDLERFVDLARAIKSKEKKSEVLLLIDGYDERPLQQRKSISDAILRYQALNIGRYYVTCREYYQVFDLPAPEIRIDGFELQDQYRFSRTFMGILGCKLESLAVVDDLRKRGFDDFLAHPLLLALACIVKSSSVSIESRSVIRLLERAMDVLTYRWDEEKGIDRRPSTPLDGRDRIQILKRLAYQMEARQFSETRVLSITKQQLDLLQFSKVDPRQVLMETARFFGIFIPGEDGWEFVHKTLHDFLAAQYWVESGEFAASSTYKWNARTAYAACLLQDATSVMESALCSRDGVEAFIEILSNGPLFNHKKIAQALIEYYSWPGFVDHYEVNSAVRVTIHLNKDFVLLGSSKLLESIINRCCAGRGKVSDTIAGYCLMELRRRNITLDSVTYAKALALYRSGNFTFNLLGVGSVSLSAVSPERPVDVKFQHPDF